MDTPFTGTRKQNDQKRGDLREKLGVNRKKNAPGYKKKNGKNGRKRNSECARFKGSKNKGERHVMMQKTVLLGAKDGEKETERTAGEGRAGRKASERPERAMEGKEHDQEGEKVRKKKVVRWKAMFNPLPVVRWIPAKTKQGRLV